MALSEARSAHDELKRVRGKEVKAAHERARKVHTQGHRTHSLPLVYKLGERLWVAGGSGYYRGSSNDEWDIDSISMCMCVVLGGVEACRGGGAQGEQRRTRTTGPGQNMP